MKYIKEYLEKELNVHPIGEITLQEDLDFVDNYDVSGVFILIGGKFTGIFVSHIDYYRWIENKYTELLNKLLI